MTLMSRRPNVGSLAQMTHRFKVTPAFPILCRDVLSSIPVKALRICPSRVATKPRYDRSSILSAALKLCPTNPPSEDSTNACSLLYNKQGSANVCNKPTNGTGTVCGNAKISLVPKL